MNERFPKIVCNIKVTNYSCKKDHFRSLTGFRMCLCRWMQHSSYNSKGDIYLTASKDGIILINSLHFKFRSVNCLSTTQSLIKPTIKSIKASLVESIFSKALCFQHILLNTFKQKPLKY